MGERLGEQLLGATVAEGSCRLAALIVGVSDGVVAQLAEHLGRTQPLNVHEV